MMHTVACMLEHVPGCHRAMCASPCSPALLVLGIELRLSSLEENTFTCWAISQALSGVCVCICVYVFACMICVYVCVFVCIQFVYMCVCLHVYDVCICATMYVCMCM